jgi:hypothetical protein
MQPESSKHTQGTMGWIIVPPFSGEKPKHCAFHNQLVHSLMDALSKLATWPLQG